MIYKEVVSTSEKFSFNLTDAYKTLRGLIVFSAPVLIMNLEKLLNNSSLTIEDLTKGIVVGLVMEVLRRYLANHQTITNVSTPSGEQTTTTDQQQI